MKEKIINKNSIYYINCSKVLLITVGNINKYSLMRVNL